jgi:hypothetical protein
MSCGEGKDDRPFASECHKTGISLAVRRRDFLGRPLVAGEHYPLVLIEIDHRRVRPLDRADVEGHRLAPVEGDRLLPALQVVVGATDLAFVSGSATRKRAGDHEAAGELDFGPLAFVVDAEAGRGAIGGNAHCCRPR